MKTRTLNWFGGVSASLALGLALSVGCGPGSNGTNNGGTNNGSGEEFACGVIEPSTCELIEDDSQISGDITLDGSCYRIDGRLTVDDGTLEISPATQLYFSEDGAISVADEASLKAVGAENQPVCMQGEVAERGYWRGLNVGSSQGNVLDHVVLEHAGSEPWTVRKQERNHGGIVVNSDVA
ncbi:MAG: hypothetical protein ACQEVA_22325, partial [Myxococcota bacterium]